ncbi:MAG TPA: sigma-70 family RNA polymerase sigma factor [Thermoanaerobaculia bacterium]|jgi:RNA polymerase sigma-70 factor (ECF subfamily)
MSGAAVAGAPPSESTLLARLRCGDDGAYEILVRENSGRMLAVARRYVRNEEAARDAVQEAFVSAFRSIARFQGGSSLSTWLHRIVVNACLMKLRSGRRHAETSIEELLPRFDETGHRISVEEDWSESAEAALSRHQTCGAVRAAIDRLPEAYRTVLILRDIEELSTAEAAAKLRTTPTAVKVRLHRARQALRTLLAPSFAPMLSAPGPSRAAAPPPARS